MEIVTTPAMRAIARDARASGTSIAFVPTMGALHQGHLTLLTRARALAPRVVLSVFVNPAQFGPGEDYDRYPRTLERDARLAEAAATDHLWTPTVDDIYPQGYQTFIEPRDLATTHEGSFRPGHFRGVATVVYRLLCIVRPDVMVLGQKDAQQCAVLEALAQDLELGVRIERHRTVREPDGVALSSRNAYLSADERRAAGAIPRALRAARALARDGADAAAIGARARAVIDAEKGLETQYADVVDGKRFGQAPPPGHPDALLVVAARCGMTRLIDNCWLNRPDTELEEAC